MRVLTAEVRTAGASLIGRAKRVTHYRVSIEIRYVYMFISSKSSKVNACL